MKRIFAFRPILFVALFVALGIMTAYFAYIGKILELIIAIILSCILPIMMICYYCLPKLIKALKYNQQWQSFSVFTKKYLKFFCILICCVVLGFSLFHIAVDNFESGKIQTTECSITGIITKNVVDKEEYMKFYLRNCSITDNYGKSKNLEGITQVYAFFGNSALPKKLELGDTIWFKTTIKPISIIKESEVSDEKSIDSFNYKFNIRYECSISKVSDIYSVKNGVPTIAESVNESVLNLLLRNMAPENAYLSWSVLFGDSSFLNTDALDAFKISGVMHIIAVSGMNVAIIVAIFLGLFKLFRCKRKILPLIIITGFLIFYCWLCAFTPSVVRATIMALVFLFGSKLGRKGDLLSNLGLSALIILLIQPLMLFEPGFLLSFGSLLGIILLNAPIYNFFKNKFHIPASISLSLSSTLSAQVGIYPILASFFNYISTYSLVANLIVIPVFEFAYVVLFIVVILALFLPFLSFALYLPEQLFAFINWFPTLFVTLPNSVVVAFSIGIIALIFYVLCVALSKFILVSAKVRTITCSVLSIMVVFGITLSYFHKGDEPLTILPINNGNAVLFQTDCNMLVGVDKSAKGYNKIDGHLNDLHILSLNYLLLWEDDTDTGQGKANAKRLLSKYGGDAILTQQYIDDYSLINWLINNNINYHYLSTNNPLIVDKLAFNVYCNSKTCQALCVNSEKITVLFLANNVDLASLNFCATDLYNANVSNIYVTYKQTIYFMVCDNNMEKANYISNFKINLAKLLYENDN